MLVVAALGLVVAAAVFLVTGLTSGEVGDLYLSMVLCGASLVVLAVSARAARPRLRPHGDQARPLDPEADHDAPATVLPAETDVATEPDPAPAPAAAPVDGGADEADGADEAAPVVAGDGPSEAVGAAAAAPVPPEGVEVPPAAHEEPPAPAVDLTDDGALFPIADYDALEPVQILPLVPRLYPDEVPTVAARERATKARPAVLDALAAAADDPALAFPVPGYEDLTAEEVTSALDGLDDEALDLVRRAERAGAARAGVLVAVTGRLEGDRPRAGAPA
ncbi:hypothetical protein PO878_11950 [Iamia majanohamensis]|uniref:Uncharacterized protein n=1 Tax=Iamia majanohamensis TaxID=467976 RepID=A0AAF0BQR8_9ACTN|nr:hypothetical protein [Iamia majanohamensis]WCO65211.1 hypothetical protein PO878_11950 [Iamia majanohamensis]